MPASRAGWLLRVRLGIGLAYVTNDCDIGEAETSRDRWVKTARLRLYGIPRAVSPSSAAHLTHSDCSRLPGNCTASYTCQQHDLSWCVTQWYSAHNSTHNDSVSAGYSEWLAEIGLVCNCASGIAGRVASKAVAVYTWHTPLGSLMADVWFLLTPNKRAPQVGTRNLVFHLQIQASLDHSRKAWNHHQIQIAGYCTHVVMYKLSRKKSIRQGYWTGGPGGWKCRWTMQNWGGIWMLMGLQWLRRVKKTRHFTSMMMDIASAREMLEDFDFLEDDGNWGIDVFCWAVVALTSFAENARASQQGSVQISLNFGSHLKPVESCFIQL